jgi:hypothetical protein
MSIDETTHTVSPRKDAPQIQVPATSQPDEVDELSDESDYQPRGSDEDGLEMLDEPTPRSPPPTSTQAYLDVVKRQAAYKNKENLEMRKGRPYFTDRQERATRVEWTEYDEGEDDEFQVDEREVNGQRLQQSRSNRAPSSNQATSRPPKRQKTSTHYLQDDAEEDAGEELEDDVLMDPSDQLIAENERALDEMEKQREQFNSRFKGRGTEHSSMSASARQERQTSQVPSNLPRPSQQNYADAKHLGKMKAMSQNVKPVQIRRAWSLEACSRLQELIERNGTSWAFIEKLNDPLLEGRGQVALKDKARNMKFDYLK